MIPTKLTLTGFIGIKSGMGLDTITIDFSQLVDPDAQLVAFKGDNGKGKSTVLDNLHPYRLMPSRAGSYSPGSFSFYDNTTGDASKILEWQHDGQVYRSTLLIKGAGNSKKTEAYLHRMSADGWEPFGGSDGKAATYDAALEQVLGTPEMFFTAVFASQGRKPLSSYTNGDIKALMAELLGLDNVKALGVDAQEVVRLLTARLSGYQQTLAQANALEDTRSATLDDLDSAKASMHLREHARLQATEALQEAREALATVAAQANQVAETEARRQALTAELQHVNGDCETRTREIKADMDRLAARRQSIGAGHTTRIADLINLAEQHRRTVAEAQQVLAQREAIERAVATLPEAEHAHDAAQGALEALAQRMADQTARRAEAAALLTQGNTVKQEGQALAQQLARIQEQAGLCDAVPCHGTAMQDTCQLLADAKAAAARITDLQAQVEAKRAEYQALKDKHDVLTAAIDDTLEAQHQAATAAVSSARDTLEATRRTADKAPALATAQTSMDSSTIALADIDAKKAQADEAQATALADIDAEVQALDQRALEVQQKAQARLGTIQQQLADLPPADTGTAKAEAQAKVSQAEASLVTAEQMLDDAKQRAQSLQATIDAIDTQLKGLATARKDAAAIEAELSHWRLLSKALGADGIIALSIDDAGPTIASICNDLLTQCYGPRFTVSIETQAETKAGTQKEVFDVMVLDGQQDEKKSIRSMSGGERIWINECLTRAIALFQSQQSGRQYGCLFADESDGALDPERKVMFMAMKKAVLKLGGYQREFMITHTPELLDLVDAVIDMESLRVAA